MAHVVFLWHMHQPYYVDPATQTATMPWVRLHCVKGYLDMISVIEDYPRVRLNFNLTPILVLQIRELIEGRVRDRWLDWSRRPAADLTAAEKFALLENFFKVQWDNLVKPFPRYWELLNKRGLTFYRDDVRRGLRYFTNQEFLDLQTWFNLAWCGYSAERLYPELTELKRRGRGFTEAEKNRVLDIHLEVMRLVLEKYRAAEDRGQVELTTTAFFHPILPLVYDSALAERSLSGRQFPPRFSWPQDAAAQLTLAVEQHAAVFGRPPRGFWPSEGSIAPELIPLMQRSGLEYFCSDEENLFNSLKRDPAYRGREIDHLELFHGWRVRHDGASINAVFREKPLSDFIGFMAAKKGAAQAATHLLFHLRHIAEVVPGADAVVPLILDGENAWDTFLDGGEAFLRALYAGIERDPERLSSTTIEDYFRAHPPRRETTTLHTGSWIGSNFDIWIGEAEENRAWELLGQTRTWLQGRIDAGQLTPRQKAEALREIYAAEGSDWFWWYGPDFSTDNDPLFDDLFRAHLRAVYLACGATPPARLDRPISISGREPDFTVPTAFISPSIRGDVGAFFDWIGAGVYQAEIIPDLAPHLRATLTRLAFGNDERALYFRLELAPRGPFAVVIEFDTLVKATIECQPGVAPCEVSLEGAPDSESISEPEAVLGRALEIAFPLPALRVEPGSPIAFHLRIDGLHREFHPPHGSIQFTLIDRSAELENWIV